MFSVGGDGGALTGASLEGAVISASGLEILQDMYDHIDDLYHPVTGDLIKITTKAPSKLAPVQSNLKASTDEINNHINGSDSTM